MNVYICSYNATCQQGLGFKVYTSHSFTFQIFQHKCEYMENFYVQRWFTCCATGRSTTPTQLPPKSGAIVNQSRGFLATCTNPLRFYDPIHTRFVLEGPIMYPRFQNSQKYPTISITSQDIPKLQTSQNTLHFQRALRKCASCFKKLHKNGRLLFIVQKIILTNQAQKRVCVLNGQAMHIFIETFSSQ